MITSEPVAGLVSGDMLALFDLAWYEEQTGVEWDDKWAALQNYLSTGWLRGYDPRPLFSGSFYLESNPDVRNAHVCPLEHFVRHGHQEGRDPHPLFSISWYRDHCPAAAAPSVNPLVHYLTKGSSSGFKPNPEFDPEWYRRTYRGVIPQGTDPAEHFITTGAAQGFFRNEEEAWKNVRHTLARRPRRPALVSIEPAAPCEIAPFPIAELEPRSTKLLTVDIWDTVLRRDCHPDEIKLQSARFLLLSRYWDIRPGYRNVVSLYRRRLQVENSSAPKKDFEYRFSLAAKRWVSDVLEPGLDPCTLDDITAAVLDHEIKAETRSIRVDGPFLDFLKQAPFLPPTIFLSDFYLESTALTRLLGSQGLSEIFVRGYSSCDTYQNKRSGDLFRKVLKDFAVQPHEVVHVGDHPVADVKVPSALGIRSYHYKQPHEEQRRESMRCALAAQLEGDSARHHELLRDRLAALAGQLVDPSDSLGHAGVAVAPLAVSFILHVVETALRFGVERVYFFTREGQFFKELYERVVACDPYNLPAYPAAQLLEVSRVATFAASLESTSASELMRMWNQYSRQSLAGFCRSLNLDPQQVARAALREGLPLDELVEYPWQDTRFCNVLADPEVSALLTRHLREQRAGLHAYLAQQGFLEAGDSAVIVDIGWRGTIQDNLCRITGKYLHGCYLGLFGFLNEQPPNSGKTGWVFDHNRHEYCAGVEEVAPFEMIFNGAGGSVVGYSEKDGRWVAMRTVVPKEEAVVERHMRPLQNGILKAADEICRYVRLHGLMSEDLRGLARTVAEEVAVRPPAAIATAFFELEHNETFGTGETVAMEEVFNIEELASLDTHALHAAAAEALRSVRWKQGLLALPSIAEVYPALNPVKRNALPLDFRLAYGCVPIARHGLSPRVAIYAPGPLIGSGGHRTIFNIARRLHKMGMELYVYLESESAGLGCVEEYLAGTPARVYVGWDRSVPVDFALATIAHSAAYVAEHSCPFKGYLVQDFEAGFNPLSDAYLVAENSYCHGLTPFTIGNWLSHVLRVQYGVVGVPAGLGVDTTVYRRLEGTREDAVCFLYQPDKPRRTPELGIRALRRLKALRPQTRIYVYGSDLPLSLDFEVENLGLLRDLGQINDLYNRCKVGLCISMSNPSRIPYEMMAAGCIPVDVYRYNNLLDHESSTAVLAYQSDASIAHAMLHLLEDEEEFSSRSTACMKSARTRTLEWEQDVVCNWVADVLNGEPLTPIRIKRSYADAPIVAGEDLNEAAIAFCEWQKAMASL